MRRARIGALARRIITQFRRDHRTMVLLFVVPIVVLTLLAYMIRTQAKVINVAVVNQDVAVSLPMGQPSLSQRIIEGLKDNTAFTTVELSLEEANTQMKEGETEAIVVFPQDFSQQFMTRRNAEIYVMLEGSDPQTSAMVLANLNRTVGAMLLALNAPQGAPASAESPVELKTSYLYAGEEFDALDRFAPVFISLFSFFLVFLLTSVAFLRERAQGTMERLLASPLNRSEIILGYMLGFSIFAFIQSLVIFLFTIYVLQVHYLGNPLVVFLIIAILALGSVNLGIFLSTYARNELQVVQFIPLVITPQALLCGLFWPIENMPMFLQWIARALPLTYATEALQQVMIKGFAITEGSVPRDILILVVFAAVMVVAGTLTLRREVA